VKRLAKRPNEAGGASLIYVVPANQPKDDREDHGEGHNTDPEQDEADLEQPPANDFQHSRNVAS
jgi:hypothetical protein